MPEAAVDEYRRLAGSHHDVRASGQFLCVKTEADPHGMQRPAYDHLRLRVLAARLRHEGASLFGVRKSAMISLWSPFREKLRRVSRLAASCGLHVTVIDAFPAMATAGTCRSPGSVRERSGVRVS